MAKTYQIKYVLLLFLGICNRISAQHTYPLDYILEYDFRMKEGDPPYKRWLWVNANTNSFRVWMQEAPPKSLAVDFIDIGVCSAHAVVEKELVNGGGALSYDCKLVHRLGYFRKAAPGDFTETVKDTVVNGKALKFLTIIRSDKGKSTRSYVLIAPDDDFSACPLLYESDFRYDAAQPFPAGIVVERYQLDENGRKCAVYTLKDKAKIPNSVIILDECDYSR